MYNVPPSMYRVPPLIFFFRCVCVCVGGSFVIYLGWYLKLFFFFSHEKEGFNLEFGGLVKFKFSDWSGSLLVLFLGT